MFDVLAGCVPGWCFVSTDNAERERERSVVSWGNQRASWPTHTHLHLSSRAFDDRPSPKAMTGPIAAGLQNVRTFSPLLSCCALGDAATRT